MGVARALRYAAALALAATAGGCGSLLGGSDDQPEIAACRAFQSKLLKAPATMKMIGAPTIADRPINLADFKAKYMPGESNPILLANVELKAQKGLAIRTVGLEYDAENSFGVPIRGPVVCEFLASGGATDAREALIRDAESAASEQQMNDLIEAGIVAPDQIPGRRKRSPPCCIR
jgi:hypothetical protein